MTPVVRRWLGLLTAAAAGACSASHPPAAEPRGRPVPVPTPEIPPVSPSPAPGRPRAGPLPPDTVVSHLDVKVGLLVGGGVTAVGGGDELVVTDPAGGWLASIPGGVTYRLVPNRREVTLTDDQETTLVRQELLVIRPRIPGAFVRIDGRDYRGEARAFRDRTGLTVVNRLGIESYLAGVVPLEIGPRRPEELQAVMAQAVVSRTFAVRNLGRWRDDGFDFYPTVADQVYGGVAAESPIGWQAVLGTRGEIVTYHRAPIDAFFYSTCGGRTADGTEVFRAADRPYLRTVDDRDPEGQAYCRASPRYRWREEWNGDRIQAILHRTLPEEAGVRAERVGAIHDVRVRRRSRSDRVSDLAVDVEAGTVTVNGAAVRRTLLRPGGELLWSATFALTADRASGRVTRLVAEGRGSGHGVGLCQWGAIGRAVAGQRYPEILQAYFPATRVEMLE